ncbi:MAG: monofunctional biosynthetic peptidoglycan transglycosylase [Gammaproteobacteria bacterium]|nr:monofunctional biosynthetic peptidoglycan transglycosylase [Gammaproteobacteria bacterium]
MARRRDNTRPTRSISSRIGSFVARTLVAVLVLWLGVTAGAVALLRYVDPPVTAMMFQQPVPLREVQHHWVERRAIAVAAAHAVIAAEDQRFLTHNGFDLESIERALEDYRAGEGLRGASTITQQVAKNLFLWPGRSFVRKGVEAYFTLLIEAFWTKERTLEVYLNVAELGTGVFGVEAAARRFFRTSAGELTAEQAALLAAVLPSPRRYSVEQPSDYVRGRRDWVLGQMRSLDTDGHFNALAW